PMGGRDYGQPAAGGSHASGQVPQGASGSAAPSGFRPATAGRASHAQGGFRPAAYGAAHASRGAHGAGQGQPGFGGNAAYGGSPYGGQSPFGNGDSDNLIKVRKKRHKGAKIALIIVGIVLALVVAAGAALALWINSLNSSMSLSEEDRQALSQVLEQPAQAADGQESSAFYMLILGSDAREGDTASRSDVTMLARIDPDTATVDLISIPRDTMVTIEGQGTQKINAAYAFGGAAGAVECVSEFAGVPISHYAEVHFDELENVVDTLGGIWVDVPESFDAGNGGMAFEAGEQKLNGEQALAYARERYNVSGGDFGRAQAQRQIVEGIIKQVLASSPAELPNIIGQLAESVSTDYSVTDMVALAQQFLGKDMTMYSAACPSYSLSQDGVSYVATMFDEWRAMMQRVDAGLDPNDETAEIPEAQASDPNLGAATNSPAPQQYEDLAANAGLTTDDVAPVE
ncbi:LCP family protein, partial [Slackia equolifaciens]